MDREICIIECALRCVALYHHAKSHDELMRLVAESLKVVYLTSMALATILESASKLIQEKKSMPEVLSGHYPLHVIVEAEDMRMDIINENTLQMTRHEYEWLLEDSEEDKENQNPHLGREEGAGLLSNAVLNAELM